MILCNDKQEKRLSIKSINSSKKSKKAGNARNPFINILPQHSCTSPIPYRIIPQSIHMSNSCYNKLQLQVPPSGHGSRYMYREHLFKKGALYKCTKAQCTHSPLRIYSSRARVGWREKPQKNRVGVSSTPYVKPPMCTSLMAFACFHFLSCLRCQYRSCTMKASCLCVCVGGPCASKRKEKERPS